MKFGRSLFEDCSDNDLVLLIMDVWILVVNSSMAVFKSCMLLMDGFGLLMLL